MIINPTYVFTNIFPNEICKKISSFLIHPFTESRIIREDSIKNFLKKTLKEDIEKNKLPTDIHKNIDYDGYSNVMTMNSRLDDNFMSSLEYTKTFIINFMFSIKIKNLEKNRLDTFLKTFFEYYEFDNESMNPNNYLSFEFINYSGRVKYILKQEWMLDIEYNNIKAYWDIEEETFN